MLNLEVTAGLNLGVILAIWLAAVMAAMALNDENASKRHNSCLIPSYILLLAQRGWHE